MSVSSSENHPVQELTVVKLLDNPFSRMDNRALYLNTELIKQLKTKFGLSNLLSDSNTGVDSTINRRVSLFYQSILPYGLSMYLVECLCSVFRHKLTGWSTMLISLFWFNAAMSILATFSVLQFPRTWSTDLLVCVSLLFCCLSNPQLFSFLNSIEIDSIVLFAGQWLYLPHCRIISMLSVLAMWLGEGKRLTGQGTLF